MEKFFFAYPSDPPQIGAIIAAAAQQMRDRSMCEALTWSELDIPGRFISSEVLAEIARSQIVIADITRLNFNVTFEIGYAIGRKIRVLPVQNVALQPAREELSKLGLFDTLGYKTYASADDLVRLLSQLDDVRPLREVERPIQTQAPVYLVEPLYKDDAAVQTMSRLKKTRLFFRNFDPKEQSRLSAVDAIQNVAASAGVIVRLLSKEHTDFRLNNLRGAFVAGLAHGLARELLILQEPSDPVPIDYRDLVHEFRDNRDIEKHLSEFAPRVVGAIQSISESPIVLPTQVLEALSLGASAAENEFAQLRDYYVRTDEYRRAIRGEVRIAVGRKGTGKSALFFQARDAKRQSKANVVLDLKPEGHQFKRLRDTVLSHISDAAQEHLATAFWEYLLTLELSAKILQSERQSHLQIQELIVPYHALSQALVAGELDSDGDFSERILALVQRLSDDFPAFRDRTGSSLSPGDVAQLLYTHNLPVLQRALQDYLHHKEEVWILVDNIDKGWPTRGIGSQDILLLRGLLDATRKLERHMSRKGTTLRTIVFLRNDVYELLLDETPDRGKEARVSLDWTDGDRLRELIRRRIVATSGSFPKNATFDDVWRALCVSHVRGEESSELLIDLSLMRPRNLINLVEYCRSNAVNLGHERIQEDDIQKAMGAYSHDMCTEISLEIRDVFPRVADNALYAFLYAPPILTLQDVEKRLQELGLDTAECRRLIEILLWFSFLGVVNDRQAGSEEHFCHTVHYDMKKLRWLAKEFRDPMQKFCIHRAFRSFLGTEIQ